MSEVAVLQQIRDDIRALREDVSVMTKQMSRITQLEEDIEFARRTEVALDWCESHPQKKLSKDEFLAELETW